MAILLIMGVLLIGNLAGLGGKQCGIAAYLAAGE